MSEFSIKKYQNKGGKIIHFGGTKKETAIRTPCCRMNAEVSRRLDAAPGMTCTVFSGRIANAQGLPYTPLICPLLVILFNFRKCYSIGNNRLCPAFVEVAGNFVSVKFQPPHYPRATETFEIGKVIRKIRKLK